MRPALVYVRKRESFYMNKETSVTHNSAPVECPKTAMILAAGLGKRMHPITQTMPKPLVKVQGKAMLDRGLDALERVGVEQTVVNVHHHAGQLENYLQSRVSPEILISDERAQLLDSGGGVKNALSLLGDKPFYLLNGDSFWIEGSRPNLQRMAEIWDEDKMDLLMLLANMTTAVGFNTKGDFNMDGEGRLLRRCENEVAPFAYAGAMIVNPKVFENTPDGAFSLNILFDRALEQERLFGLRLEGLWLHVGTPDAIREAEEAIARSAA